MANGIKIGASSFDALKIGSADVDAAYIGSTLVYSGGTPPTPPTPTYEWKQYNEGDAIPSESVYKTYGFRIPTQAIYDIVENGKYFEISFYSEEIDEALHPVSVIGFTLYSEGFFLTINGSSQEISYDPESDEYLEIIFSDYGADYNYSVGYVMYGEEGDASQVYDFPFDIQLYEEYQPTLQWVTFNAGDTVPSTLNVYGISGDSEGLMDTFSDSTEPFYIEPYRRTFDIYLVGMYYDQTDNVNYIFSDMTFSGLGDYINFNTDKTVWSYSFKLYIYV